MAETNELPAARDLGPKGRKRAGAILDAALSVLLQDGYALLSLRNVAARAGVHLGHLQYYYRSKQELLHAVIERELGRLGARIEARVEQPANGTEHGLERPAAETERGLGSLVADMLAEQQSREVIQLFAELRTLALRDPAIGELVRRYTARCWRALVGVILASSPRLGRPRAERRAALLVALLEGLLQFRSPDRPRQLPLLGLERELAQLSSRLLDP